MNIDKIQKIGLLKVRIDNLSQRQSMLIISDAVCQEDVDAAAQYICDLQNKVHTIEEELREEMHVVLNS